MGFLSFFFDLPPCRTWGKGQWVRGWVVLSCQQEHLHHCFTGKSWQYSKRNGVLFPQILQGTGKKAFPVLPQQVDSCVKQWQVMMHKMSLSKLLGVLWFPLLGLPKKDVSFLWWVWPHTREHTMLGYHVIPDLKYLGKTWKNIDNAYLFLQLPHLTSTTDEGQSDKTEQLTACKIYCPKLAWTSLSKY